MAFVVNLGNNGPTEIKPPAEIVISKNGKVYYKSLYDTVKKYISKNRERINNINKERYKNDENYRERTKSYSRNRNLRLKMIKEQEKKEKEEKEKEEKE